VIQKINTLLNLVAVAIAPFVAAASDPVEAVEAVEHSVFRFEAFLTLDDMRTYLKSHDPVGSSRTRMRQMLIEEAHGTLFVHPTNPHIEKYVYDINLCDYYIWRWNISADFDDGGRLLQTYVNGEPLFGSDSANKKAADLAKTGKASIFKISRPRPQAFKGESKLAYLLLDGDGDLKSTDDQVLTGPGPSRADPYDLGKIHSYANVDPWRSIFDSDEVAHIAPYTGNCSKAKPTQTAPRPVPLPAAPNPLPQGGNDQIPIDGSVKTGEMGN